MLCQPQARAVCWESGDWRGNRRSGDQPGSLTSVSARERRVQREVAAEVRREASAPLGQLISRRPGRMMDSPSVVELIVAEGKKYETTLTVFDVYQEGIVIQPDPRRFRRALYWFVLSFVRMGSLADTGPSLLRPASIVRWSDVVDVSRHGSLFGFLTVTTQDGTVLTFHFDSLFGAKRSLRDIEERLASRWWT